MVEWKPVYRATSIKEYTDTCMTGWGENIVNKQGNVECLARLEGLNAESLIIFEFDDAVVSGVNECIGEK